MRDVSSGIDIPVEFWVISGGHTSNSSCNVVNALRETRMPMWYWYNLRSLSGCSDRCVMYAGLVLVLDYDSYQVMHSTTHCEVVVFLLYAYIVVNSRRYVRA